VPNPNGKNGKPLKIELPFEAALIAAVQVSPLPEQRRKPREKKA
jgi:hypothetical protein